MQVYAAFPGHFGMSKQTNVCSMIAGKKEQLLSGELSTIRSPVQHHMQDRSHQSTEHPKREYQEQRLAYLAALKPQPFQHYLLSA
jgi:hypothetical protein